MAAEPHQTDSVFTVRGHRLRAISVVRDRPLHWTDGGYYEIGRWLHGEQVTARVETDRPPSIAVFARIARDPASPRRPEAGWNLVWEGSATDYALWDGAARRPHGDLVGPIDRWLTGVPIPSDQHQWPTGVPSTTDFTTWKLREADDRPVTLAPREHAWLDRIGALVDAYGRTTAQLAGIETGLMNNALAEATGIDTVPLRWDPVRSVLLCPPDRVPEPCELRRTDLLRHCEDIAAAPPPRPLALAHRVADQTRARRR